jgi:hypothetical protein
MTPHRTLVFALDFDCTFTADIEFWRLFVHLCVVRGHRVWVLTARHDTPENHAQLDDVIGAQTLTLISGTIFSNHKPKRAVAEERDIKIDIWIDDLPEFVGDASQTVLDHIKSRQSITETLPVFSPGAVDPAAIWAPKLPTLGVN